MARTVELLQDRKRGVFRLVVDGHEVENVTGYELRGGMDQLPSVTVSFRVTDSVECCIVGDDGR